MWILLLAVIVTGGSCGIAQYVADMTKSTESSSTEKTKSKSSSSTESETQRSSKSVEVTQHGVAKARSDLRVGQIALELQAVSAACATSPLPERPLPESLVCRENRRLSDRARQLDEQLVRGKVDAALMADVRATMQQIIDSAMKVPATTP